MQVVPSLLEGLRVRICHGCTYVYEYQEMPIRRASHQAIPIRTLGEDAAVSVRYPAVVGYGPPLCPSHDHRHRRTSSKERLEV